LLEISHFSSSKEEAAAPIKEAVAAAFQQADEEDH
jgi:hypothetical protein